MAHWVRCTDCGRVLLVEDGPTCEDCLTIRRVLQAAERVIVKHGGEIIVSNVEPEPAPEPTPAPKKRGGCCG